MITLPADSPVIKTAKLQARRRAAILKDKPKKKAAAAKKAPAKK